MSYQADQFLEIKHERLWIAQSHKDVRKFVVLIHNLTVADSQSEQK